MLFSALVISATAAAAVVVATATTVVRESIHAVAAEEPKDKENDYPCAAAIASKKTVTSHYR